MAPEELADHRRIFISLDSVIRHELKGHGDCLRIATGINQCGDGVIAHMDVQKLIHIRDPYPVRRLDVAAPPGMFQRLHLVIAPLCRIWLMADNLMLFELVQQGVGLIRAVIGIKKEIGHTDDPVKRNPFQQERAFVFHAGDRRNLHHAVSAGRMSPVMLFACPR